MKTRALQYRRTKEAMIALISDTSSLLRHPASDFCYPLSVIGLPSSDFRLQTSDLWPTYSSSGLRCSGTSTMLIRSGLRKDQRIPISYSSLRSLMASQQLWQGATTKVAPVFWI